MAKGLCIEVWLYWVIFLICAICCATCFVVALNNSQPSDDDDAPPPYDGGLLAMLYIFGSMFGLLALTGLWRGIVWVIRKRFGYASCIINNEIRGGPSVQRFTSQGSQGGKTTTTTKTVEMTGMDA